MRIGQIPRRFARRCCNFVSSVSPSRITSSFVDDAVDTCCIHTLPPSVHCLEQHWLSMLDNTFILLLRFFFFFFFYAYTGQTYLGGKMVFRTCWLLYFVWADFSLEDSGEQGELTWSNVCFMLHTVLFVITM